MAVVDLLSVRQLELDVLGREMDLVRDYFSELPNCSAGKSPNNDVFCFGAGQVLYDYTV